MKLFLMDSIGVLEVPRNSNLSISDPTPKMVFLVMSGTGNQSLYVPSTTSFECDSDLLLVDEELVA